MLYLELLLVVVLIAINGVLAMSELAMVSARRPRLQALAEDGNKGAQRALDLQADHGRLLSTVQIGITLVGVLAGAFSGATIATRLDLWLEAQGVGDRPANAISVGLVVSLVTYLSLVAGELVPKQIALRRAERVAILVAGPMYTLSRIAAPVVHLLDWSTRMVLRLLGHSGAIHSAPTEDEIRSMVAEAETAGVVEPEERQMISSIMRLGDRPVRSLLTPRLQIDWIDATDTEEAIRATLAESGHSLLPVCEGELDRFLGVARARDCMTVLLAGQKLDVRKLLMEVPAIPDTMDAIDAIPVLKTSPAHIAFVLDEYGHLEGVLTPADLLDAIVGGFADDPGEPEAAVRRDDGSWLIDGMMAAETMADMLRLKLPEERNYNTIAGFVLDEMQRLPTAGDWFEYAGWRFEVVDMDGRRIDKILAQPPAADEETTAPTSG